MTDVLSARKWEVRRARSADLMKWAPEQATFGFCRSCRRIELLDGEGGIWTCGSCGRPISDALLDHWVSPDGGESVFVRARPRRRTW